MSRVPVVIALGLLLGTSLAQGAAAQIFHWVDDTGTSHYTDRLEEVPPRYRNDVADIEEALREETVNQASGRVDPVAPAAHQEPEEPALPEGFDPAALEELQAMMEQDGGIARMLGAMGAGLIVLGLLGFLVGIGVVTAFSSLMLILACRLVGAEPPGFVKGMGIAGAQLVANVAVGVVLALVIGLERSQGAAFQGASFAWSFVIYAGLLHALHGTGFGTSLLVSVVATVLAVGVGIVFVLLAVCAGGAAMFSA